MIRSSPVEAPAHPISETSQTPSRPSRLARANEASGTIALVLLVATVVAVAFWIDPRWMRWGENCCTLNTPPWIPLATALIAAIFIVVDTRRTLVLHRRRPPRFTSPTISTSEVEQLATSLRAKMTPAQYELLVDSIVQRPAILARIKIRIEPRTRVHQQETDYYFQLNTLRRQRLSIVELLRRPTAHDHTFVTVTLSRKGHLHDAFAISRDGEQLPTLSFSRAIALYIAVIDQSFRDAGKHVATGRDTYEQYSARFRTDVVRSLVSRAPIGESQEAALKNLYAELLRLAGESSTPQSGLIGAALVWALAWRYPIVAELPPGVRNPVIRTRSYFIADRGSRDNGDWIRGLFGVRNTLFKIGLHEIAQARSYHLEFMGPEGTYLTRQYLAERFYAEANANGYLRLGSRQGQRYAHLYARDVSRTPRAEERLVLAFNERPPGSLLTALMAAAVLMFGCIVLLSVFNSGPLDVAAEGAARMLAVLVALPAAIAGWAAFHGDSPFSGGIFAARASLALSAALSVLSTASALLGNRELLVLSLWASVANLAVVLYVLVLGIAVNYKILNFSSDGERRNGKENSQNAP